MIRLVINGFEVDLREDIDIDLNLTIADGRNPLQRKRTGSEVIKLADTPRNRQFFYTTYELSLDSNNFTASFNPAQRVEAQAYDGEFLVFDGLFQIKTIKRIGDAVIPEGILYSNFLGIYETLGDIEVASLGWDEYDHTLTTENIVKSWFQDVVKNGSRTSNFDTRAGVEYIPKGFGYYYPLADWGLAFNRATPDSHFSNAATNPKWRHNELFPCVYAQEVLKKIFEFTNVEVVDEANTFYSDINYTDAIAVRETKPLSWLMLAPEGGDYPKLTSTEITQRSVTLTTSASAGVGYNITQPYQLVQQDNYFNGTDIEITARFNTLSKEQEFLQSYNTTSVANPIGQYSATLGKFTISRRGRYILSIEGNVRSSLLATFNVAPPVSISGTQNILLYAVSGNKRKVIGFSFADIPIQTISATTTITLNNTTFLQADGFSLELEEGEEISIVAEFSCNIIQKSVGGSSSVPRIFYTAILQNTGANVVRLISNDGLLLTGDTVKLSKFIPKIKCSDFLSGIIKMYNLYVSDVTEDGKIYMNTLDGMQKYGVGIKSFYKSKEDAFVDWSRKIDKSKEIEILPMPVNNAKNYVFKFKEQLDYFNDLYRNSAKKLWGSRTYQVPTTFQKGDEVIELPFATTPPIQVGKGSPATQEVVIPRIINFDASKQLPRPFSGNPHLFYMDFVYRVGTGTQTINIETTDGASRIAFNYYRSLSNLAPLTIGSSRLDLLFETPDILYYDLSTMRKAVSVVYSPMSSVADSAVSTYATVNTFDFHRRPLFEITNSDSKLLRAWFDLTEKDLSELDFSKLILIDGTYFRLSKLEYRVGSRMATYCELMKVLNFETFKPTTLL